MSIFIQRAKLYQQGTVDLKARQAIRVQCKANIHYFIENFVWIYEPRLRGDKHIPMTFGRMHPSGTFEFAYQREVINVILEAIENEHDIRIEKSRDVGLSWLVMIIFTWGWLFHGWDTVVGSKNADSVDKLNNLKALLPKIRLILSKLPVWLLPEGFELEKHAGFFNIFNPETKNSISGEANSATFATGARAKAILFDEFAKWEHTDRDAWTSAGAASPCRIALSTPYYKANKFFELKSSAVKNLQMHYSRNPFKDNVWKQAMLDSGKYTDTEWAQEFEIDYSGTNTSGVFHQEVKFLQANRRYVENLPFIQGKPVYVSMDLGIGDMTTVCCWQVVGFSERFNLFDYYENSNQDIFHYIEWIKSPDRVWNQIKGSNRYREGWRDVVVVPDPNQASNRELTSGRSMEQIFQAHELEVEMRWVGEREGISLAKKLLKKAFIKRDLTEFINALEGWHYQYDPKRGEFKPSPVHDLHSHACKALIYFAAYIDDPDLTGKKDQEEVFVPEYLGVTSAGL